MSQVVEFIGNHGLLVGAFIAVLAMLIWNLLSDVISGIESVPPLQAVGLINHDNALVLDVRETSEFENGHIINALHIAVGSLGNNLAKLDKYRQQPIVVGCASGNRSSQACRILKKNGFEKVYNLKGGMLAWQSAGLPVAKQTQLKGKK
jgi:rhodanese-related sulfurtransferase